MKALHSSKVAAEKDAFLKELLSKLPEEAHLVTPGKYAVKARRLHEKYLPIHILAHYKPVISPLKTEYFVSLVSHWIESECLFALGFKTSGLMALRGVLEAAIKLVYYENHPIELLLHRTGSHDLSGTDFRNFLYSVPGLGELSFNSKSTIELLWGELCKFVHGDLRVVRKIGVVADIESVYGLSEKEFSNVINHVEGVAKTAISCCLSVDPNWLLNVEKAYFDAVFDLYSTQERSNMKLTLRIA